MIWRTLPCYFLFKPEAWSTTKDGLGANYTVPFICSSVAMSHKISTLFFTTTHLFNWHIGIGGQIKDWGFVLKLWSQPCLETADYMVVQEQMELSGSEKLQLSAHVISWTLPHCTNLRNHYWVSVIIFITNKTENTAQDVATILERQILTHWSHTLKWELIYIFKYKGKQFQAFEVIGGTKPVSCGLSTLTI